MASNNMNNRKITSNKEEHPNQGKVRGKSSVEFSAPVYIIASAAVGGDKEGKGPLGAYFDMIARDNKMGAATWEEAESLLQQNALRIAMEKASVTEVDIRYLLCGDLLGQSMASNFGTATLGIPFLGLYGACSTCGESLCVGSMLIDGGYADKVACVTSSHFASAEKEFRFPLDYGNQRPLSASWTVTASGAFILSNATGEHASAVITGITPGKVVDYGLKDSMNMGACMAPAAADTLVQHFLDFGRTPSDYDRIVTGDLGVVGQSALLHLMRERGFDITSQHMDCGIEIFGRNPDAYEGVRAAFDEECFIPYGDTENPFLKEVSQQVKGSACKQDTHNGGSGCGCAASVLSAGLLHRLQSGEWKRILFIPTGALLSKVSFNEGNTVPGIAHAVVLETAKKK